MARSYLIGALLVFAVLLFAATSRSDSGSGSSSTTSTSSPLDAGASGPTPGHQPFTPYDPGPPGTQWQYSQLTAGEQAYVNNLQQQTAGYAAADAGFASASAQLAQQAQQQAAQLQIGLDGLASAGVIP